MIDRADLEGHEYRLEDLNRLRDLARELGFEDVLNLLPASNYNFVRSETDMVRKKYLRE